MNVVTQLTQFVGRDVINKNTNDLAVRCSTGSVELVQLCRYKHPFTVVQVDRNWHQLKNICDFVLVLHCNYMPIFCRFRDITIFWLIMCVFAVFRRPISLEVGCRGT